jgi:hypothetical protein
MCSLPFQVARGFKIKPDLLGVKEGHSAAAAGVLAGEHHCGGHLVRELTLLFFYGFAGFYVLTDVDFTD